MNINLTDILAKKMAASIQSEIQSGKANHTTILNGIAKALGRNSYKALKAEMANPIFDRDAAMGTIVNEYLAGDFEEYFVDQACQIANDFSDEYKTKWEGFANDYGNWHCFAFKVITGELELGDPLRKAFEHCFLETYENWNIEDIANRMIKDMVNAEAVFQYQNNQ